MKTHIIYILLLIALPASLFSQQVARQIRTKSGVEIGFLETRPANYGKQKHPVIIFLHGNSERGNGKSDLKNLAAVGLTRITRQKTLAFKGSTFIVLSPQLDRQYGEWQFFYIDEMLKYAKTLSSDTNRIYLTGLSMGGGGAIAYASQSVAIASQFAAIVPVCAACFYDYKKIETIARAGIPVWAFVGDADKTVKPLCTTQVVDAINGLKPAQPAKLTVYKNVGHNSWDRAYDPTHKYQRPNVYEWMLQFKKPER